MPWKKIATALVAGTLAALRAVGALPEGVEEAATALAGLLFGWLIPAPKDKKPDKPPTTPPIRPR
jgi:hypothetical protein